MLSLPIRRGYPVPYFAAWNGDEPDFRVMDHAKLERVLQLKRCWICGVPLGRYATFATEAIAGITRMAREPPCHHACAEFAVQACPFLVLPKAQRREAGTEDLVLPGTHDERNPGAVLLWTTTKYEVVNLPSGRALHMGEPTEVKWYAQGRAATTEEIDNAIEQACGFILEQGGAPHTVKQMVRTLQLVSKEESHS